MQNFSPTCVLPQNVIVFVSYQTISSIIFKRRRYRPFSLTLTCKTYFRVSYYS